MINLHEIFPHIDSHHVPTPGTRAHAVLTVLADGQRHSGRELENVIASNVRDELPIAARSALQALGGKQYGFWLVHNRVTKGQPGIYQLDSRHLTGNPSDDPQARSERHRGLLVTSLGQAQRETRRVERALAELEHFQAENV